MEDKEPAFHSPPPASVPASVHAQPDASTSSFVTSNQLKEISDLWAEQFARFEALLSGGNVFSTPKTMINPIPSHTVVSDTPFIAPSARLTGQVEFLAEVESDTPQDNTSTSKNKKKSRKSRKEGKVKDTKKRHVSPSPEKQRPEYKPTPVHTKPPVPAQATSGS